MTSRPRFTISTRSTVCATSASTWLETSTVLPPAANVRRKSRSQRTPSGSSPLAGSSRIEQLRVAEQRRRQPEPLPHAERVALHAAPRRPLEAHDPQHLVGARVGQARGARERQQVVAPGAAGVEVGRLEHGADAQRRTLELRVGLVEDERAPARRRREAEQHAQRRRLPGAVRAEEAVDRAGLEREREVVDGDDIRRSAWSATRPTTTGAMRAP